MTTDRPNVAGRCLVVHPVLSRTGGAEPLRSVEAQVEEAKGLAAAINLDVLAAETCKVARVSPGSFLGTGQREKVAVLVKDLNPDVVIVNHTLSPVQQRNLEKEWSAKVIDRTGLILEIFGARAATREGRIQVDLAALTYQRSRLVKSWTHLERQRGGMGKTGGPGESQLEIDRRLIDDKIAKLKRELEDVRQHRDLERKGREKVPFPVVALVGYTNAGKSTLFNALTGADVFAENLLFATLDPTMRRVELPNGQVVILSDTVGFISDLPTHLVAAFRATLEQIQYASVILHVRDVSAPDFEAQRADVADILEGLGIDAGNDPRLIEVWNKIDVVDEDARAAALKTARDDARVVCVSALSGQGLEGVREKIQAIVARDHLRLTFAVPVADGRAQAWLHQHADVMETRLEDDTAYLTVDISPMQADRFRAVFGVSPEEAGEPVMP